MQGYPLSAEASRRIDELVEQEGPGTRRSRPSRGIRPDEDYGRPRTQEDVSKADELAKRMVSGEWSLTAAETETQAILADSEAMKAIGEAENEVVLASFRDGIIALAHEAEVWGSEPGVGVSNEVLLERVWELMETAFNARKEIRAKYKVSLL